MATVVLTDQKWNYFVILNWRHAPGLQKDLNIWHRYSFIIQTAKHIVLLSMSLCISKTYCTTKSQND